MTPKSGNSVELPPGYIQTRSTGNAIDRLRQWSQSYTLDRVTERSFLDVFRISVWDYFRFTKIEKFKNPAPRFEKQPKNSKRFSFGYLSTNNFILAVFYVFCSSNCAGLRRPRSSMTWPRWPRRLKPLARYFFIF